MSTGTYERNGQTERGHELEPGLELFQRPTFVESQAKGEVDTQIATAKRFPRSIKQFKERALSLATLDPDTAASCFYSLPRDGKTIEGPSARLAEIVAASWGNMRAQASIVSEDGEFITAQGRCWDLENNVAVSTEVRRRITGKGGKRYSSDMINTTANAACSIALRNAVFKVVPMAIVKPVYDQARRVAIGDASTLVDRRSKMIAYFQKMGVSAEQVCAAVDRASVDDITIDDLATLLGMSNAIKEGDTTVDEAFPKAAAAKTEEPPKSKTDKLAAELGATTSEPANATPADTAPADNDPATLEARWIARVNICVDPAKLSDLTREANEIADDGTRVRVHERIDARRKEIAAFKNGKGGQGTLV